MQRRLYIVLIPIIILLGSCGGQRGAAPSDARYRREPIKEVSQEQLNIDARLIEALSMQESGHTTEALEAYAKLTEAEPGCAAAWYEMGRLLMQRGWTDSALACANRAVALNGDNVWYLLEKAQVYEMKGDGKGMAQVYEQIVKIRPEELEQYYGLSNAYIAAGDLSAAVEVLNRVERKIGITEPISLQKQRLWDAAGRPDKAVKELEALAASMPQEKRYSAILAELYMKQRKFAKAKENYDRILRSDPDDEYIHIQLAEYYKQTGNPLEADREMLKAFENKSLDSGTKLGLLRSFYTAEEFYGPRSSTTFRLLEMEGCSDSAQFAPLCGDVAMRQQKYDEAARWFELALSRDSSNYTLWEALLICLTETPQRETDLVGYAQRASQLFPMHTLPYYIQGAYHIQHEHYAEALQSLQSAQKWGFNKHYLEADTYRMMAEAYYRLEQYDNCWDAFDQALKIEPNSWGTLNNYAYYLAEQRLRLDDAERMSRRTIEAEPQNANSLDTYAWILHLLGRNSEAMKYIERAVRIDGESATLQSHYNAIKSQQ